MNEWIIGLIGLVASITGILTFFGIPDYNVLFGFKKNETVEPKVNNSPVATDKIDFTRLPNPSAELVGRSKELRKLTNVLKNKQLVHIYAGGGVGKSALIFEWLQRMQPKKYHDVEKVFAWSFYSQGSHDTQNSSIDFFQKALPFFGHTGEFPKDDTAKGRALAKCLRNHSFILILDGLEPLQHPAHILDGELKDTALRAFLDDVHYHGLEKSPSLIVISSRQPLAELDNWSKEQYLEIDLQTLSPDDGVKLFRKLKVTGTDQELKQATQDMGGHALALVLLGKMLVSQFGGDIAQRDRLPALWEEEKFGAHAKRVLAWYATYWKNSIWVSFWLKTPLAFLVRRLESKERSFLNLLSLFDRPMGLAEKDELVKHAECAAPLRTLNDLAWQPLEKTLENAGLLLHNEGMRTQWDCHPLIRNYFAQQFKETRPDQFRQAHRVLFEYYQKVPQKQQPDTLAELEPLYRAVVHGCLAGEYWDAEEIYWSRILRGEEKDSSGNYPCDYYSQRQLGAYSKDLTILSKFFNDNGDWSNPVNVPVEKLNGKKLDGRQVTTEDWSKIRAWLSGVASYCLMSLGRLEEALAPRKLDKELEKKLADCSDNPDNVKRRLKNVSKASRNLSDLQLLLGKIEEATQTAKETLEFAKASGNSSERVKGFARYAWIAYVQGEDVTTEEYFKKAEHIQQQNEQDTSLPSFSGFLHCSFLLEQTNERSGYEDVLKRAQYIYEDDTSEKTRLLHVALESLITAKVYHKQGNTKKVDLDQVVIDARKAETIQYLPMFLIDRANFYLDQQQFDDALRDLDEAWQIIKRSDMKLYAVDYHLAMSRYYARVQQPEKVQFHENEAKKLIEATGYHLRKV